MMTERPLLYAHRGAAAELPENTLAAFTRALEIGADALETDLHMTVDGHIVVSHDPTALRMTGVPARLRDATIAQVKEWDAGYGFVDAQGHRPFVGKGFRIPTLEELLIELPGVHWNVDIKQSQPPMIDTLLSVVARTRSYDRVTIASFSTRTMVTLRYRGYPGATAMSRGEVLSLLALPPRIWQRLWRSLGGTARAAQIPTRGGPFRLDTRARIDALHALGLRVEYWTINAPDEARRLLELGADGIMTDDPGAIKPVFDALYRARPRTGR